jgi:hypothetical protein
MRDQRCSLLSVCRVLSSALVSCQNARRHIPEDTWGDPGVGGRIIVRWIFRKWDVGLWTGLRWLRIETGGGNCECGNEPSGSIKCGEFLD